MTLAIGLYAALAVFCFILGMYAIGAAATVVATVLFVIEYKRSKDRDIFIPIGKITKPRRFRR